MYWNFWELNSEKSGPSKGKLNISALHISTKNVPISTYMVHINTTPGIAFYESVG